MRESFSQFDLLPLISPWSRNHAALVEYEASAAASAAAAAESAELTESVYAEHSQLSAAAAAKADLAATVVAAAAAEEKRLCGLIESHETAAAEAERAVDRLVARHEAAAAEAERAVSGHAAEMCTTAEAHAALRASERTMAASIEALLASAAQESAAWAAERHELEARGAAARVASSLFARAKTVAEYAVVAAAAVEPARADAPPLSGGCVARAAGVVPARTLRRKLSRNENAEQLESLLQQLAGSPVVNQERAGEAQQETGAGDVGGVGGGANSSEGCNGNSSQPSPSSSPAAVKVTALDSGAAPAADALPDAAAQAPPVKKPEFRCIDMAVQAGGKHVIVIPIPRLNSEPHRMLRSALATPPATFRAAARGEIASVPPTEPSPERALPLRPEGVLSPVRPNRLLFEPSTPATPAATTRGTPRKALSPFVLGPAEAERTRDDEGSASRRARVDAASAAAATPAEAEHVQGWYRLWWQFSTTGGSTCDLSCFCFLRRRCASPISLSSSVPVC